MILKQEVQNEKFKFSHDYEDIHMNIEMALKKKSWKVGWKTPYWKIEKRPSCH